MKLGLRHTVGTAKIALIQQRYAQIMQWSAKRIGYGRNVCGR